ncbi:MAG: hypothetical protein NTU76_02595 [Candidatus Taylorbacteria bacterium]|nr:hypothetical protein [Candidatus Taylorbacteria bacterium]
MEQEYKLDEETLAEIRKNPSIRKELVRKSHLMFFLVYFGHYIEYDFAPMHYELFKVTDSQEENFIAVSAFRSSAKSTILTMSYILWSMLGKQKKRFCLIASLNSTMASVHMKNIVMELERNDMLRKDLGPFKETTGQWGVSAIEFASLGAKIMITTPEQGIRGVRYGQYRPDLIVCDDIEDLNSAQSEVVRNKTRDWFNSEILPIGSDKTRIIVIGNMPHQECLMAYIRDQIRRGTRKGLYLHFPIIDDNGNSNWLARFPNKEAVEKEKLKIADERAWEREYMLNNLPENYQIVRQEDIHYYDKIPNNYSFCCSILSVDPAITDSGNSDSSAIVIGDVYLDDEKGVTYLFVRPDPILGKMNFCDLKNLIINLKNAAPPSSSDAYVVVHATAFQKALSDQLTIDIPYNIVEYKPTVKKIERLATTVPYFRANRICFPAKGCENILKQILNPFKLKHDDLLDAFTMMIWQFSQIKWELPDVYVINTPMRCSRKFVSSYEDWEDDSDCDRFW